MNRLLSRAIGLLMVLWNVSAEGAFLEQGAEVRFDAANYLRFEDVGRTGSDGGYRKGQFVRLRVHRGEQEEAIDLVDSKGEPLIASQVREIRYRDRDHVWVIARQGHLGNGALLYDLAQKRAVRRYGGGGFYLSPDARKILQVKEYDIYRENPGFVVYIDDVIVYPTLVRDQELARKSKGETSEDRSASVINLDGVRAAKRELKGPVVWRDENVVEFGAMEYPTLTAPGQAKRFRVSGLELDEAGDLVVEKIVVQEITAAGDSRPTSASQPAR